jgi:putative nucleotidyltransferase with HDIG domain
MNLKDAPGLILTKNLLDDDFVSYYAVPLIAKGQLKGVLEVFHRAPLEPDAEWLNFLNTLAGQVAIAVENATLFESLQRSNSELTLAYDATIEGWSRALDLRDKETEGHTLRVTEMALKLARAFGLSEDELVQVRWGALLHDIGKMGIPDEILHKPGPLTAEEWALMKKHPTYAYEMLAPIRYLRLALDIPYCHHEKWDGSGYPQGLMGDQIPLTARIFAVVDVWDALSSDRPYRAAWTEKKVRDHIQASSGTHFDPQVVEVFLRISH